MSQTWSGAKPDKSPGLVTLMLFILNVLNYLIFKETCQGCKQTINYVFNLLTDLFLRTYNEQGTMLNIVGEKNVQMYPQGIFN